MKSNRLFSLFLASTLSLCAFSQLPPLRHERRDVLEYTIPKGYKKYITSECFKGYPHLKSALHCTMTGLFSNDDEIIVIYYTPMFPTVEDSIRMTRFMQQMAPAVERMPVEKWKNTRYPDRNSIHRNTIRNNLGYTLRKSDIQKEDIEKHVTFFPPAYAKEVYNADSVATYYFWPSFEDKPYRGKYIGAQAIMAQKRDKGYFVVYCFYTEKAKENLDRYLKQLEGVVRFKE